MKSNIDDIVGKYEQGLITRDQFLDFFYAKEHPRLFRLRKRVHRGLWRWKRRWSRFRDWLPDGRPVGDLPSPVEAISIVVLLILLPCILLCLIAFWLAWAFNYCWRMPVILVLDRHRSVGHACLSVTEGYGAASLPEKATNCKQTMTPNDLTFCGQLQTPLSLAKLRAMSGRQEISGSLRESSHYASGWYLHIDAGDSADIRIERAGHQEYLVHADADQGADLLDLAHRISAALAREGIRHRFELYAPDRRLMEYLHHDWPSPGATTSAG